MTRDSWKDIFEAAGFIAVVGSLIFVGLETRNSAEQAALNTRAVEIAAYQELINLNTQANLTTLTEPELVELLIKAERSPDTFSAIERRQYLTWVFLRLRLADMAYFQYERGVIDEERLRSAIGPLRGTMRSRAAREQWQNGKGNFVQSFQDFMDEYISEIPMVE